MKSEWHDIIFNVNIKLEPDNFFVKCVNEKIKERLEIWRDVIYSSFGENLPCIWKDFIEHKKILYIADPEALPFVGLYEIVNTEDNGKPIAIILITFDPVNLSASVDLLCANEEFSKKYPFLSGRLVVQLLKTMVRIFKQLKPLYVIMLVIEWNTGINSVVKKLGYKRRAFLPDYFLIQSNDAFRRKGAVIWDKFYR